MKLPISFKDKPRMNTNRHEYRWTSFAATPSRNEAHPGARASRPHAPPSRAAQYVYDVAAGHPVGRNRIVPAPLPLETGGGGGRGCARTCAGGTPALPGGGTSFNGSCCSRSRASTCRASSLPIGQSREAWWPFVVLRVSFVDHSFFACSNSEEGLHDEFCQRVRLSALRSYSSSPPSLSR